jgi:trimethylamine--corrinoid protein Co-methyltransferase
MMQGIGRKGLRAGLLSLLTEGDVEQIHDGALHILARTGIIIHHEPVLSLLEEAGCQVFHEDRRVHIPAPVVEQAVTQAPAVVYLYSRLGEQAMALGAGRLHTRTSSGAIGFIDLDRGQRREPTSLDAANAARLADALPHVHGVSTMEVQPADVPVTAVDVHATRIALANTVKPLGYVCLNETLIEPVLDMLAVAVRGEEALRERPIITALAESTSPLQLVSSQMSVLQAFALRGLPLTLHAHPMAGLTAPVTLCGELVITHAEVLALVTIAQLVRPGTPVAYGMSSSVPDMRSGTNLSGAVEIGLLGAAVAKLAKRCGLPCLMSTGTDAHVPGAQSVMERLMTLLIPALAGVDLVNLTTLDTKMSFSLEQLVMDEALLGVVERCLQGITVDDSALALDLIHDAGPGGTFIATDHTLGRFREELLIPDLIDRQNRESWQAAGAPDMRTHAREKALRILADHHPVPLADDVAVRLDEIVQDAEARSLADERDGTSRH